MANEPKRPTLTLTGLPRDEINLIKAEAAYAGLTLTQWVLRKAHEAHYQRTTK